VDWTEVSIIGSSGGTCEESNETSIFIKYRGISCPSVIFSRNKIEFSNATPRLIEKPNAVNFTRHYVNIV
jgi:hypothetical protein